jgi:hypothetical protein
MCSTSWSIKDPVVATTACGYRARLASEVLASFIGETLTRLLLHETWSDSLTALHRRPTT